MIHQLDIFGKDKVENAIEAIQGFATIFGKGEGYYLAFSGGKDSVVIKKLADMAGVKYDAHYSLTTVDPPELVRFIKEKYPDVSIDKRYYKKDGKNVKAGQQITMWNLIPEKKMPPTRLARYCCEALKESGGDGRLVMTGVRWAESANRKHNQGLVTIMGKSKKTVQKLEEIGANFTPTIRGGVVLGTDNAETRQAVEFCYQHQKTTVNPIIDWDDSEVWEFIREYNVPYCELYEKGWKRIGCIGCPMNTQQQQQLDQYPIYKRNYIKAFKKMIEVNKYNEPSSKWKTAEQCYAWWVMAPYKEVQDES